MKELTVNWHITEACNFKCQYCFAHWENKPCKKELYRTAEDVTALLDEICKIPGLLQYPFEHIRLNLVGGETFLHPQAVENIVKEAKARGMRLSAITNGSQFTPELIQMIAENFDIIGVSIDSANDLTNLAIGRQMKGKAIDTKKLVQDLASIRQLNPNIELKVNTVVNKCNYFEDLNPIIEQIKPNKWKVFKMLPSLEQSRVLEITEEQFHQFVQKHQNYKAILFAEDNDEMAESYLMIDPNGRFFQNGNNEYGYTYSQEIHHVGVKEAFSQIEFNIDKFLHRYQLRN